MTDLSRTIEALTAQWGGLIHSAALRYGLDTADREDVLQRVRVRLWRALERGGGDSQAITATYAYQAAVSAAIDIVRERRTRRAEALPLDLTAASATDEPEILKRLEAALEQVEQSRRVAVRLHLVGRSLSEIAQATGWTDAKTRNLVYRGLDDLRRILTEEA
jgi:RNA polymerase sigma-70 factor (ECF subfamily)